MSANKVPSVNVKVDHSGVVKNIEVLSTLPLNPYNTPQIHSGQPIAMASNNNEKINNELLHIQIRKLHEENEQNKDLNRRLTATLDQLNATIKDLQNQIKNLTENKTTSQKKRKTQKTRDVTEIDYPKLPEKTGTKNKEIDTEQTTFENEIDMAVDQETDHEPVMQIKDLQPPPTLIHPPQSNPTTKPHEQQTIPPQIQHSQTKPENNKDNTTKLTKTVPIILREAEKWTSISMTLSNNNVKIASAKRVHLGIQIIPRTPDDHRKITHIFGERKIQFHTYLLPEEKNLNVIIRGLQGIPREEIEEDLIDQGFNPIEVYYLKPKNGAPPRLVKVLLPKSEKDIYNIKQVCNLIVTVESQKSKGGLAQCHNCQNFNHAANKCFAQPRCVRCDGAHHFLKCTKPKTEAPKCVNCGGNHPASYGGCPSNPKNFKKSYANIANPRKEATPNIRTNIPLPNNPNPLPHNPNPLPNPTQFEQFFTTMQNQFNIMMKNMKTTMMESFAAPTIYTPSQQ